MQVLLLNADYRPVQVLSWERAVCLVLEHKARTVEAYTDRTIRSPGREMAWPAVVALAAFVRVRTGPRLNRRNVFARDGYTCVYCGSAPVLASGRPDVRALTLDHVVPRARATGGRVVLPGSGERVPASSWENLVTACAPCNHGKADRTPAEAGLVLRRVPRRPGPAEAVRIALANASIPPEWKDYLAFVA